MTPQRSFIHYLVVPFLIGMLMLSGYFIFRTNPEILNQESFYQKLSKNSEQSEVRVANPTLPPEVFTPIPAAKWPRQSHRFIETTVEKFNAISLPSDEVDWKIVSQSILTKDKTQLSVSTMQGALKWSFSAPPGQQFVAGALSHLGRAWFVSTTLGRIYAFDIENGDLIWYFEGDHKYFHESMVAQKDLLTFFEDKPGQSWGLEILEAETGKVKKVIKKLELPLAGHPALHDHILYFATQSGQLRSIDLLTGSSQWTSEGSSSFRSGPAVIGEKIYLTNEDGLLLGFDRKNGKKSLEIELGSVVHEPIQTVEGTNYALSVDVNGYLIAADLKANKRIWRYHLNMTGADRSFKIVRLTNQSLSQLSFNSVVAGWTAWTSCSSSRICIFDVKEGRLLHRVELKANLLANFDFHNETELLYAPVTDNGKARIMALEVYTKPVTTPSAVVK